MRLADQPEVTVTRTVAAPAGVVWELVTDLDLPARFSEEFQGAEWDPPFTGPELGARFTGRNRNEMMGDWSVPCWVTDFEPGRRFGWAAVDPESPGAMWRFELDPEGDGTRLTQWAKVGPGISGLSIAIYQHPEHEERIMERRLNNWRHNMTLTVEGIAAIAEGRA